MDTTTTVSATTASQAAKGAVAAGAQTQAEKDTAGNAFELLLRNMAAHFKGTASPLDANIVRDIRTAPEPKPVQPRENDRVEKDAKADDKAADKAAASDDAQDAKDDAANAAEAKDQAASANDAQEATQTVQMAALQAQLMSSTTITPVAVALQAVAT